MGQRNVVRILPMAALVVAALMTTGVPASASAHTAPKLGPMLLGIGQMPTGWSVAASSKSGGTGCVSNILEPKGIKQTASAGITFQGNAGLPLLNEKLATFTNAKSAYREIVAKLSGCKSFNGTSAGQRITDSSIGQMSFPRYGNASEAFATRFTVEGTELDQDLIVIRKGGIVFGVSEGDVGSVNVSQLQAFVKKAVAKVS